MAIARILPDTLRRQSLLTTDAGARLGRVLFYDPRLAANGGVACASCHQQQFGFLGTT